MNRVKKVSLKGQRKKMRKILASNLEPLQGQNREFSFITDLVTEGDFVPRFLDTFLPGG